MICYRTQSTRLLTNLQQCMTTKYLDKDAWEMIRPEPFKLNVKISNEFFQIKCLHTFSAEITSTTFHLLMASTTCTKHTATIQFDLLETSLVLNSQSTMTLASQRLRIQAAALQNVLQKIEANFVMCYTYISMRNHDE